MSKTLKRIAIIDADSILYAAATVSERRVLGDAEADTWIDTQTLDECYAQVVKSIRSVMAAVQAEDAYICLTAPSNFRKVLLATYKANRKVVRQPTYRKPLLDALQERRDFPTLMVTDLEADDVAGISMGVLQKAGHTPILCSEDKDLKTIPGLLYQKHVLRKTSRRAADYWHMWQTLAGDATDNYSGCKGVGPKTASAILEPFNGVGGCRDEGVMWERVLTEFTLRGHSEDYALTQARVARILRSDDWDPIKCEPILWTPSSTLV